MLDVEAAPLHVVLVEPEIPPNTGSIARLCAATETPLHLVGRLGFSLDDKHLRRAGLDYWPWVRLARHPSWAAFADDVPGRRFAFSARGAAAYTEIRFAPGDALVFGGETRGLPVAVTAALAPHVYRIPIASPHVRSLNLATAVAVVLYEALRQLGEARQARSSSGAERPQRPLPQSGRPQPAGGSTKP